MSDTIEDNTSTAEAIAAKAAQEEQNNRPIILTLTLGKVQYILAMLAQLPYEKSYQPIQDLQQMLMTQMQAPSAEDLKAA